MNRKVNKRAKIRKIMIYSYLFVVTFGQPGNEAYEGEADYEDELEVELTEESDEYEEEEDYDMLR